MPQKVHKLFITIISITALCIIVGGFLVYVIYTNLTKNDAVGGNVSGEHRSSIVARAVDGAMVEPTEANRPLVAVMIENHPDARPQAGLAQAKLVYEALAEGSITRMVALYDLSENLDRIGPVRSARPYYIDVAREYNALYAHSGGSPDALERLQTEQGIIDLNEFFGRNTHYFWRRDGFSPPHNLYTSSVRLADAASTYKLTTTTLQMWQFKDDTIQSQSATSSNSILINYSKDLLSRVEWKYDSQSHGYQRWQSGEPHYDENGTQLTAKNIVIQIVNTNILDEVGRKEIKLLGSGRVQVFQDGEVISGTWKRPTLSDRTRYYAQDGSEISFNRGQTWIELVPDWVSYSY